jgi:hypothetical protein
MTRSVVLMVLCFATSSAICATSSDKPTQTPELLLNRIRSEGAAAVVRSLWGKTGWSDLTDHVASGNRQWVDVAMAISPGTDAGATEELSDALFVALGQNPAYVLKVLPMEESGAIPLALSVICSGRTDALATYDASISEQKKVEAAVEKVTVAALESKKRECLMKLKAGEADLKRFFAVP